MSSKVMSCTALSPMRCRLRQRATQALLSTVASVRHVPVTRAALLPALCGRVGEADRAHFQSVASLVTLLVHQHYHELALQLERGFEPFDTSKDATGRLRGTTAVCDEASWDSFLSLLSLAADKANFERIPDDEVAANVGRVGSHIGLRVEVSSDQRLVMWCRGREGSVEYLFSL